MITKIAPSVQPSESWQSELARAIRDPDELLRLLNLPSSLLEPAIRSARRFPLRVTQSFLARMEAGNPNDPLLRQVLPLAAEETLNNEKQSIETPASWGQIDPVGDTEAMASPGLLHKYQGRVLLVSTAACGIHCRYCFRQYFPYQQANPLGTQLPATLAYLNQHTDVHEVILSGGDPLSISDNRLAMLIKQLAAIPHLKTLRIHTRLPVVLPQRLLAGELDWLNASRLSVVMVVHINHPREINEEFRQAIKCLQGRNITLLNQSVLLKGVNDSTNCLIELSHKLLECGILPYYLHQLDKVTGAAHFEVPISTGHHLIEQMRAKLPGYLVPRYVQEIAGQAAKTPLYI